MRFALYQKGIGMMLGLIFGAGMFAMPAAVARAGIWWGTGHFIIAFILILVLQLWFAEIAFFNQKQERFTGFVRRWLGKKAEIIALLVVIVGYYGSLLAYGVLGGIFLYILLPFLSLFWWSILFLITVGFLIMFNFRRIGIINFYLTIPLVLFVGVLSALLFPHIDFSRFISAGSSAFWFLPYGIFIFAFGGIAAIPETSDIVKPLGLPALRNVITISMLIAAVFYFLFIMSVVGVTGETTTDDALAGLAAVVGGKILFLGALIGFLAVLTSHLALGADMRNIFHLDYRIPRVFAWLLTVAPPVLLFLLGFAQFLDILSFVGAVALGVTGILIFFMARSFHKAHPHHVHSFLSTKNPISVLLVLLLVAGVLLEALRALSIL